MTESGIGGKGEQRVLIDVDMYQQVSELGITAVKGGIFIDDAGTPGIESKSRYLDSERKSWAAVVIPPSQEKEILGAMDIFLLGIHQDFGADELHFTDIEGGRGKYKNAPIKDRYQIIELMALLFENANIPVFYQTSSPESLRELRRRHRFPDQKVGWFSFDNHEHFSLWFLIYQVVEFVRSNREVLPSPLPVIVDEGLVRANSSIELPSFGDVVDRSVILSRASHKEPFLQLADFAAFVIARQQWLAGRGDLKFRDKRFLEIVSGRLNIMNLPTISVDPDALGPDFYDELLQEDRLFKGFLNP